METLLNFHAVLNVAKCKHISMYMARKHVLHTRASIEPKCHPGPAVAHVSIMPSVHTFVKRHNGKKVK
jgi:hypothetical protein